MKRILPPTLILLLVMLTVGGCQNRHLPSEPVPELHINWAQETPESLLTSLKGRAGGLDHFTAYFQMSMDPPPAKMPSSFSGILYLSKDPDQTRLRIRAFHMFGTTLFDMVTQEGTTKVYIPSRETLYVGSIGKAKHGQQGPQEVFSSLMVDFSHLTAKPDSTLTILEKKVLLPLTEGEIQLEKKSGNILSVQQGNKTIRYGNYQQLVAGQPAMPTNILLTTARGSARCQLKEITIYDTMDPKHFDLSSYQVKEIKTLSEAGAP